MRRARLCRQQRRHMRPRRDHVAQEIDDLGFPLADLRKPRLGHHPLRRLIVQAGTVDPHAHALAPQIGQQCLDGDGAKLVHLTTETTRTIRGRLKSPPRSSRAAHFVRMASIRLAETPSTIVRLIIGCSSCVGPKSLSGW